MSRSGIAQSQPSLLNRIATELYDVEEILEEIQAQERTPRDLETPFVAPRTPTERTLADIWAELLDLDRVGVHDDFFDLGGHSLLATQVLSRVREAFQVELPLDVYFTGGYTVATLAEIIEQYQIEQAGAEEIATMLAELDELSDEEVKSLLEDGGVDAHLI